MDKMIDLFENLGETQKNEIFNKVKNYFENPEAIKEQKFYSTMIEMFKNDLDFWVLKKDQETHNYCELEVPFTPELITLFLIN